jgi:hypothetical protein
LSTASLAAFTSQAKLVVSVAGVCAWPTALTVKTHVMSRVVADRNIMLLRLQQVGS